MFFSPYKVWIHSPPIGVGMEAIGTHLNSAASSLSAGEMELATSVVLLPLLPVLQPRSSGRHYNPRDWMFVSLRYRRG